MDATTATLIGLILTAAGWLSREIWRYRKAKSQAGHDATEILRQRKAHLEDMISKSQDYDSKERLRIQLDETNAAILGLYTQRLRQTIEDAGLPHEEMLIEDGRSQLKPQQVTRLRAAVREVRALPPSRSAPDLLVLGYAYYHMEQYEEAISVYDRILNLYPNDPATLNSRGMAYQGLKKYEEALADHNLSLELRPNSPATLSNRGVAYQRLKKYEEAFADLNSALELRPGDPDVLYNLACLFSLWGKPDEALAYLEKAIDGDEKNRKAARTDEDFENIRDDPRFKKLTESE